MKQFFLFSDRFEVAIKALVSVTIFYQFYAESCNVNSSSVYVLSYFTAYSSGTQRFTVHSCLLQAFNCFSNSVSGSSSEKKGSAFADADVDLLCKKNNVPRLKSSTDKFKRTHKSHLYSSRMSNRLHLVEVNVGIPPPCPLVPTASQHLAALLH